MTDDFQTAVFTEIDDFQSGTGSKRAFFNGFDLAVRGKNNAFEVFAESERAEGNGRQICGKCNRCEFRAAERLLAERGHVFAEFDLRKRGIRKRVIADLLNRIGQNDLRRRSAVESIRQDLRSAENGIFRRGVAARIGDQISACRVVKAESVGSVSRIACRDFDIFHTEILIQHILSDRFERRGKHKACKRHLRGRVLIIFGVVPRKHIGTERFELAVFAEIHVDDGARHTERVIADGNDGLGNIDRAFRIAVEHNERGAAFKSILADFRDRSCQGDLFQRMAGLERFIRNIRHTCGQTDFRKNFTGAEYMRPQRFQRAVFGNIHRSKLVASAERKGSEFLHRGGKIDRFKLHAVIKRTLTDRSDRLRNFHADELDAVAEHAVADGFELRTLFEAHAVQFCALCEGLVSRAFQAGGQNDVRQAVAFAERAVTERFDHAVFTERKPGNSRRPEKRVLSDERPVRREINFAQTEISVIRRISEIGIIHDPRNGHAVIRGGEYDGARAVRVVKRARICNIIVESALCKLEVFRRRKLHVISRRDNGFAGYGRQILVPPGKFT